MTETKIYKKLGSFKNINLDNLNFSSETERIKKIFDDNTFITKLSDYEKKIILDVKNCFKKIQLSN